MENRYGRFRISWDLIEQDPKGLMEIFKNVLVVKAESMAYIRAIEYTGWSESFDEEELIDPPLYEIVVSTVNYTLRPGDKMKMSGSVVTFVRSDRKNAELSKACVETGSESFGGDRVRYRSKLRSL